MAAPAQFSALEQPDDAPRSRATVLSQPDLLQHIICSCATPLPPVCPSSLSPAPCRAALPYYRTLELRLVSREWNQAAIAQIRAAHAAVQLRSVEGGARRLTRHELDELDLVAGMQAATLARDAAPDAGLPTLLSVVSRWRSELRALAVPPHLLPRVLPSCVSKSLEVLDLSEGSTTDYCLQVDLVCRCLRDATGLRELGLSGCVPTFYPPAGEPATDLLAAIFGLTRLEALDASEGALRLFDDSGVEPPAQPLARLKRLDFSGNQLNEFHSTGGPVLALMAAAPNLEELSLCRCELQAVQVQMICLTATQGRLRALSLAGNGRIRPLDLQMSLRLAQWLEFLDVRATISHSDKDKVGFLDCLRQCASLRRLDARDSGWISEESLRQILAENSELTVTLNGLRRD